MHKEKAILFSAPMVNAILDGRKTQTRRLIKPQPERIGHDADDGSDVWKWKNWGWNGVIDAIVKEDGGHCAMSADCPHGQPGDLLWACDNIGLIVRALRVLDAVESGIPRPSYPVNHEPAGVDWNNCLEHLKKIGIGE